MMVTIVRKLKKNIAQKVHFLTRESLLAIHVSMKKINAIPEISSFGSSNTQDIP